MKKLKTWQSIEAEVIQQISHETGRAGELIPGEVEFAREFSCARATVNRASRQLAEIGLLDRRRKGGTRVARHPVRKGTLDVPVTCLEIEVRGASYSHVLLSRNILTPPNHIQKAMDVSRTTKLLYIPALHLADEVPFLYEDCWVNLTAAPNIQNVSFVDTNANERLIEHAFFTG